MSTKLAIASGKFKTPKFAELMPNNGLAISMEIGDEDVEIKILEKKELKVLDKIRKCLYDNLKDRSQEVYCSILDDMRAYAKLHHEIETLREAE